MTFLWPNWIELIFHIDPDEGNGMLERLIVILSGLAAIVSFVMARVEWRRTQLSIGA